MSRIRLKHVARRIWRALRSPLLTAKGMSITGRMGSSDAAHVFVCGIPRGGTSLLATILASHPNIAALNDETHFFRIRNYQYLELPTVDRAMMRRFLAQSASRAEMFDRIAQHTLAGKPGSSRFLEKTPGHAISTGPILAAYPRAQMLVALRHPLDAYTSLMRAANLPSLSPERFGAFWANVSLHAQAAPQERLRIVRYEDLADDTEREVQEICTFLGLPFTPVLLDPEAHAAHAPDYVKHGNHQRIGQSISASSVGSWQGTLEADKVVAIVAQCRDAMQVHGYEVPEL